MATIKVSGPEAGGEDERKLTPAEAKMVLDAKIRKEFRWAVRSLVGDDGSQMQSFDGGVFERVVADIRDGIIAEMRYNEDIRRAIRVGVKNFNSAYVKGVLKRAVKGKEVPNPGIIVSAAAAVEELDESKLPRLGTGTRFRLLKRKLAAKGAQDPGALAASIGRKKFGKDRFQKLSRKAKKRARKGS